MGSIVTLYCEYLSGGQRGQWWQHIRFTNVNAIPSNFNAINIIIDQHH
jgi:hypothetical protein